MVVEHWWLTLKGVVCWLVSMVLKAVSTSVLAFRLQPVVYDSVLEAASTSTPIGTDDGVTFRQFSIHGVSALYM